MQWTDRIRQVKIILVVAAVVIAVASLLVSHFLVRDLSKEERHRMEVWAQALHALNEADENTDVSLVLNVMEGNNTICLAEPHLYSIELIPGTLNSAVDP